MVYPRIGKMSDADYALDKSFDRLILFYESIFLYKYFCFKFFDDIIEDDCFLLIS